jgi:hypothetical protein
MLVKPVQLQKAFPEMLVTLVGIVKLVRPVQKVKAPLPMLATLSGIVTLVMLVIPENAELPMLTTGRRAMMPGMATAPSLPV